MHSPRVSPASPLANLFLEGSGGPASRLIGSAVDQDDAGPKHVEPNGHLIILTGPSGSGKSARCVRLVQESRAAGLIVAGFIAHPVFDGERKTAIDLEEQLSGERRRLAVRRRAKDQGLLSDLWRFDPEVLAWADHALFQLPTCDRLVLDELGPLELERGEGLQAALTLIDGRRIPLIWAVIRPSYLSLALARWPWARVQRPGRGEGGRP